MTPQPLPLRWLTIKQTCAYLSISSTTFYRLHNDGALPYRGRVGGQWRIDVADVDQYVERHAREASRPRRRAAV